MLGPPKSPVGMYKRPRVYPINIAVEHELTMTNGSTSTTASPRPRADTSTSKSDLQPAQSPSAAQSDSARQNQLYRVSNELMQVSGYIPKFQQAIEHLKAGEGHKNFRTNGTHGTAVQNGGPHQTLAPPKPATIPLPLPVETVKSKVPSNKVKSQHQIRQQLFRGRILVSDLSLAFAVLGIILTVIEAELRQQRVIDKTHFVSILLLSLVVATTVILLALIIGYYYIEVKMILLNSGTEDWRFAVTRSRIAHLLFELSVCAICPIPNNIDIPWIVAGTDFSQTYNVTAPLNILLTVPMFLRFYLLSRFFTYHSRYYQDTATRSIAALNHIPVDFTFVMKTLLYEHPLRLLSCFTIVFCLIMSWLWMHCENAFVPTEKLSRTTSDFPSALWFVMITFLSIGYGDIVATTYCGRGMAVITGVVGAVVLSAVVAVVSRYMELSRPEKHVNQFLADNKLAKERNNLAASIIQHAWFMRKYKKCPSSDHTGRTKFTLHNRKFIWCIIRFRRVIWETRKSIEKNDSLVDVIDLQNEMQRTLCGMQKAQDRILSHLETLHHEVQEMKQRRKRFSELIARSESKGPIS